MVATPAPTTPHPHNLDFSNDDIASLFEQVADLLEVQEEDFYRIRAYRKGAQSLSALDRSAIELYGTGGLAALEKLPAIGHSLALAIEELATTGEVSLHERLLHEVSPEDLFATIPGLGQVLAHRIYQQLGIETLEDLEQAAHDGTLAQVAGFGHSRLQLVRDALEARLNRASRQRARLRHWQAAAQPPAEPAQPSLALLLEVDAQYRYLAQAGQLRMVKPRRFNPEGKRWLPVMRLKKDGWTFDALYSNTARAHELGKTHDWVVIYYEREGVHGQCTAVTETHGPRRGERVVRGREREPVSSLDNLSRSG